VDAESFQFENYAFDQKDALKAALRHLLPPGTPKLKVDQILVSSAGALINEKNLNKDKIAGYLHKVKAPRFANCNSHWRITINFDADMKLTELFLSGPWPHCTP
jgi:hypothetical protein